MICVRIWPGGVSLRGRSADQLIESLLFILAAGDCGLWLILGVALFGLGVDNATSLPLVIAQQEFSPAEVSRVVRLMVAIGSARYAFAPAAFGLHRTGQGADAAGSQYCFFARQGFSWPRLDACFWDAGKGLDHVYHSCLVGPGDRQLA